MIKAFFSRPFPSSFLSYREKRHFRREKRKKKKEERKKEREREKEKRKTRTRQFPSVAAMSRFKVVRVYSCDKVTSIPLVFSIWQPGKRARNHTRVRVYIYIYTFAKAYLPKKKNTNQRRTAIYTEKKGWGGGGGGREQGDKKRRSPRCRRVATRVAADEFQKLKWARGEGEGARIVSLRVEKGRDVAEKADGVGEWQARGTRVNEKEKERRKKKQKNEYIFPLNFSGVPCVSSRAAPREFNSIFNLPKPPYANSVLEYLWTSLFSLLVAAFPYLTSLSASTRLYFVSFPRIPLLPVDFLPIRDRRAKRDGFLLLPTSSSSTLFIFLHVSLPKWVSFPFPPRGNRVSKEQSRKDARRKGKKKGTKKKRRRVYTVEDSFCAKKKKKKFFFTSSIQICIVFHRPPLLFFWFVVECATINILLISFQIFRSCRSPPSFLSLERTRRVHGGSPSIRDTLFLVSRSISTVYPCHPFCTLFLSFFSFFLEQFSRFAWMTTRP